MKRDNKILSENVLLKCLEFEWQDHFQTRVQTWQTLIIETALVAALVGIDWRLNNVYATSIVALLLIAATYFGIMISIHHRKVEILKFKHIIAIEKKLGLLVPEYFGDVKEPIPMGLKDVFSIKTSTPLFILRMHVILQLFGIIYLISRWI